MHATFSLLKALQKRLRYFYASDVHALATCILYGKFYFDLLFASTFILFRFANLDLKLRFSLVSFDFTTYLP